MKQTCKNMILDVLKNSDEVSRGELYVILNQYEDHTIRGRLSEIMSGGNVKQIYTDFQDRSKDRFKYFKESEQIVK